ncbi:hypothetical protein ONZ45_g14309 [Pleurotus djamor]|nr:hypothetical protein ONZ45_g14309 [Pleurotus djamor]
MWIKRIIITISNPNYRLPASDFGVLMSSCPNLTALHNVMRFPDESPDYHFPNYEALFDGILRTASSLQVLNLADTVYPHEEPAIPNEFFEKMTALRALRCDSQVILDKLPPLDYLSAQSWTLRKLKHNDPSIRELFIREVMSFPLSYSPNEHLRRLNLDITYAIATHGSDSDDLNRAENLTDLADFVDDSDSNPDGDGTRKDNEEGNEEEGAEEYEGGRASEVDEDGDDPESDLESMPSLGTNDSGSSGGDGLGHFSHFSFGGDLQNDALDLLPPSVTYLSLVCGRWADLEGRLQRLPATVTSLGLEAHKAHCKEKSYRRLKEVCRDLIAPGLTVVQLNHWQTCVDLRTRHAGVLKEFVEMLRNRSVELWDAEGSIMESTTP